jgi:hypothetical protein
MLLPLWGDFREQVCFKKICVVDWMNRYLVPRLIMITVNEFETRLLREPCARQLKPERPRGPSKKAGRN